MAEKESIPGDVVGYERPDWEPLVQLLGRNLSSWFMWMFEVELTDETSLHAYKHVTTRRYLHLDATGRAFDYVEDGRYREVATPTAIAGVFVGWERSGPTAHDAEDLRAAMRRAQRALDNGPAMSFRSRR